MSQDGGGRQPWAFLESYARSHPGVHRFDIPALGTENVLLLVMDDLGAARRAAQMAFTLIEQFEQAFSKFQPESELSLLNSLAAHRPVLVSDDMIELAETSRRAFDVTGGAFDPTVGPLLDAWGLVDGRGRQPGERELQQALDRCGMNLVEIDVDRSEIRFSRPGVSLDFGGVGKGFIVDRVVQSLKDSGVASGCVISGRSTVAVWGAPPGEESAWRVEISDPDATEEGLREVLVDPGVVSSSGAAERFVTVDGNVYGHVIDPRSGQPVDRVSAATVWTPSALWGDVLSTTLFVLGGDSDASTAAIEGLLGLVGGAKMLRASLLWIEPRVDSSIELETRERHFGTPGWRESPI